MSNARDKANIPALNFSSTGIDDNATSTAITIDSSQNVSFANNITATGSITSSSIIESPFIKFKNATDFGSTADSAYIMKTASTGSAPFNQAGALLYQPRTSTTEGRSNHLFYTGSPLALRQNIHPNGDISFYEDTGTTPKMLWDASAERLGIGTSSPSSTLDVNGSIRGDLELAPGKEYSMTSGAGTGTAIFDTNISLATFGILEVFYRGNSNLGGTASYQQTGLYYIQVGTGFNGSAVATTITQTEVFKHVPFGSPGALTFSSVIFDGSSEVSSVTSTVGCQIRIKIAGYNTSHTGGGTQVMIRRIF